MRTVVRNEKLTRLARGQECMVQIPGVCNRNPETTVAAHANQQLWGKGAGCKAHDFAIAFACSSCHFELDQGTLLDWENKCSYWLRGFIATWVFLWNNKLVRVA